MTVPWCHFWNPSACQLGTPEAEQRGFGGCRRAIKSPGWEKDIHTLAMSKQLEVTVLL